MTISNRRFMSARTGFAGRLALMLLALMTLTIFALPARSAGAPEPLFPPGSHIGLVPPPGMVPSKTFPGFVDPNNSDVGMVIGALPAGTLEEMQKTFTAEGLKKQGVTLEKLDTIQLSIGKGLLVIGTQVFPDQKLFRKWLLFVPMQGFTAALTMQAPIDTKAYTDAVVRAALLTIVTRPSVPQSEYLSMLPFTVGDLGGFRVLNVIPGRALLLVDAPAYPHMVVTEGLPDYEFNARSIIAAVPSAPGNTEQRANFARLAFNTIGGIKDIQMTMSEPVRINDQEGFETVARAKDSATGSNLMVVQWLRFNDPLSLQFVGISRAEIWDHELARLRTIRDSIRLKR
jgi:hypothetical protein